MKRFSLFFSMFTFVLVVAVNGSYAGAPKSAEPPQPSPLSGKVKEAINKSAGQKQAEVSANKTIKVKKASGPNAYTVAELYQKSATLDKKEVVVRGLVVKVSAEIMGKNWIHLQDGSGDPSKGTNDIVVTSQELPAVGDTVTARGALSKDKDFGYGYNYPVIVEQASIKK
ncbi:MAG: hypothetical protein A2W66_01280 [Deltaproteobacteria bacterium RIFCSPLOWO2_02_56_12]|nr:MAG: hypothetical protein A2W66_01280 [Deltaproteobacteria bacterium RIFCSPLOWO2_02_56_12]